jgi:hypothetical protein
MSLATRRVHGWRRLAIAIGLAPALAACSSSTLSCTLIGCESVVTVDVVSLAPAARPLSAMAELCVAGQCQSQRVTFVTDAGDTVIAQVLSATPAPTAGTTVPITLTVTQNGTVLLDTSTTAMLREVAPNGTECGPVCYTAALVVTGGALVPAPSPSPSE